MQSCGCSDKPDLKYRLNMYNKRTWLNKPESPSMGSVTAFDGFNIWKGKKNQKHLFGCFGLFCNN